MPWRAPFPFGCRFGSSQTDWAENVRKQNCKATTQREQLVPNCRNLALLGCRIGHSVSFCELGTLQKFGKAGFVLFGVRDRGERGPLESVWKIGPGPFIRFTRCLVTFCLGRSTEFALFLPPSGLGLRRLPQMNRAEHPGR